MQSPSILKHGVHIITTLLERIKEKEQKLNILSESINNMNIYNTKHESKGKVLPGKHYEDIQGE